MSSWMMFEAVRIFFIVALIYLAYIDWRTFRLPDVITIPLIALGLLSNYFSNFAFTNFLNAALGSISGFLFLWLVNFAYKCFRQRDGIGMGDAKLLAALGAWLGLSTLPSILLIASVAGLVGGFIWLRLKNRSIHAAFPFGPFLAIAGIIELLWPHILPSPFLSNQI
jgi:leader peptidase (prepilin peptidase) / N-methyltransferase